MLSILKTIDHWVSRITRLICVVALGAIVVMFLANVFVRFVPIYNFTQTDDWIQICLTYVLICYYGWVWVMRAHAYMQSIPWMQVKVAYAAIPISAFFMSCYALRDFILAIQGRYDDFESI